MKNSLSHIYYALRELHQGTAWGADVQVIETKEAGKGVVWWIRKESLDSLLSAEQFTELKSGKLLTAAAKKKFGKLSVAAYGVHYQQLEKQMRAAEESLSKTQSLARRVKELESELKASREHNALETAMAAMLDRLDKQFKLKPTTAFTGFKRHKPANKFAIESGVPTLLLSDWHYGEVVDGAQTDWLNEYDIAIANQRAGRVFNTALNILLTRQSGASYDGMVVAFAGDMVSGTIHEELRHTNEKNVLDCSLELAELLANHIVDVADNFEAVYVPMVPGNHGRLDMLPKAKNATADNFDTFTYKLVEKFVRIRLGNRCNVSFDIATGPELRYKVYGTRYLLTHGDTGRGREGGDFWSSMAKAASRKQNRALKAGVEDFDYMACGHFHRYSTVSNVIVNGSLKGYDEYAFRETFEFEKPIQALWLTDPLYGITTHMRIYADEVVRDLRHDAAPITPASAYVRRRTNQE